MKDQYGQEYNTFGGQYELNRALANGDYNAQVAIQNQMAYTSATKYESPYPYAYSGGGVSKPFNFTFIKKIFYLIFIFLPKFIFGAVVDQHKCYAN